MTLDPKLLEILACPEDKGPLLYIDDENFLYTNIPRYYTYLNHPKLDKLVETKRIGIRQTNNVQNHNYHNKDCKFYSEKFFEKSVRSEMLKIFCRIRGKKLKRFA